MASLSFKKMKTKNHPRDVEKLKHIETETINTVTDPVRPSPRQIQMLTVGSTIGIGLFLQTGKMLQANGALGIILSFLISSIIVYFVVTAIAEMSTLLPNGGAFFDHANNFVDPSIGFLASLIYVTMWLVNIPLQIKSLQKIMDFWVPDFPHEISSVGFILLFTILNLIPKSKGKGKNKLKARYRFRFLVFFI